MEQLRFKWYDNVPRDLNKMSNQTSKDDEKFQKKQKSQQAQESKSKEQQARVRKGKSRRYQALRADEVAHNFMKSLRL